MSNEFSYRIFREGTNVLLAVSDLSIIGKTFEEGDLQIEVSEEFYHGKECSKGTVLKLIKDATIVNAVGNRIIELMVKEKIVDKDIILIINGVPHAQIIKIKSD